MQKALAFIAACQAYQVVAPLAISEFGMVGSGVGWFAAGVVGAWIWNAKD